MRTYSCEPLVVAAPKFAERLRTAMRAAEMTVRDLEEASSVDKATINSWRREKPQKAKGVRVDRVREVAPHLHTTAEYLLDLPEPRSRARSAKPAPPPLKELRRAEKLLTELAEVLTTAMKPRRGG